MESSQSTVGVIGGTGEEGRGVALRLAMAGARVTIGSRAIDRAREAASTLNAVLGENRIRAALNEQAVSESDVVLLTVPFDHAATTLKSLESFFRAGSLLIDITVPISMDQGRVRYKELPEGSASEHLQKVLPAAIPLVAAFKTEPAHLMLDPGVELNCDTFVAGDSKEARHRVMSLVKSISGLRPIDAGPIYNARAIERMTVFLIRLNRRYKVRTGRFRIVGLDAADSE